MPPPPNDTPVDWTEVPEPWLLDDLSYHGYLPRDDIPLLLHKDGDFLLRMCEVDPAGGSSTPPDAKPGKPGKTPKKQYQLVLSVLHDPDGLLKDKDKVDMEAKILLLRNILIHRLTSGYARKLTILNIRFDTLDELLMYYTRNPIKIGTQLITLGRGVKLSRWEHTHKDITIGKSLGKAAFGELLRGVLKRKNGKNVHVTIKQPKVELAKEKLDELMYEMRLVRLLNHPNVLKFFGVVLTEQPFYLIQEYVQGSTLEAYLKDHAAIIDRDERMQMCMGVCWGLTYLHEHDIIHRDIAARNCTYDSNKTVKISDFPLARSGSRYKVSVAMRMPIKWMAPECITTYVFTPKSDVYSLGVLFYEVMACKDPYLGMPNGEAKKLILEGQHVKFPDGTHSKLVEYVNEKMWPKDPARRSTMVLVTSWMEMFTGLSLVIEEPAKDSKEKDKDNKKDDEKKDEPKKDEAKKEEN